MKGLNVNISKERLDAQTYIDFLKRTDLGSQYPKERFPERIERLTKNASISLTARDEQGRIIGVLFAITDFAYWLFITDLGVDRHYVKNGIGKHLMELALEKAGGPDDIIMYTCANENAVGFYEKFGMEKADDIMMFSRVQWTSFQVQ